MCPEFHFLFLLQKLPQKKRTTVRGAGYPAYRMTPRRDGAQGIGTRLTLKALLMNLYNAIAYLTGRRRRGLLLLVVLFLLLLLLLLDLFDKLADLLGGQRHDLGVWLHNGDFDIFGARLHDL